MQPSRSGVIAPQPSWQPKEAEGAPNRQQGQDAAPGEGAMSGREAGQTTPGLLEEGAEGLRTKAVVGPSLVPFVQVTGLRNNHRLSASLLLPGTRHWLLFCGRILLGNQTEADSYATGRLQAIALEGRGLPYLCVILGLAGI